MKKLSKLLVLILALALAVCAFAGLTASASEPDPVATKAATATIAAKNLSYTGAVQVMYYVSTDAEVDPETQELKVLVSDTTFDGKTLVGVAPSSVEGVSVKQQRGNIAIPSGNKAGTYALFYSDAVAPVELRKDIYAVAVLVDKATGNITYASSELEYSPYLYAMDRFSAQPSENQLALYKALLDYGAAVQTVLIKGDDETTFEEKLAAVGGWADAYYLVTEKTSVNGTVDETKTKAPDYYRPSSVFSATRFASGNTTDTAYTFDSWTSGATTLKSEWLSCSIESLNPGRQELVKNYVTTPNRVVTHTNGTGISNAGDVPNYTNKNDSEFEALKGTYYRYTNGAVELGKHNKQAVGGTITWNTGLNLNVGVKYIAMIDFNLASYSPIDGALSDQWILKLFIANSSSGTEISNVTLQPYVVTDAQGNKSYDTSKFMVGSNHVFNTAEWHTLRIEANLNASGKAYTYTFYIDDVKLTSGIHTDATNIATTDGNLAPKASMSYISANLRSGYQTTNDISLLLDNAYTEVVSFEGDGSVNKDKGKYTDDSINFSEAEDLNVSDTTGLTVADGVLKYTTTSANRFGFANSGSATANGRGATHVFEAAIKVDPTNAAPGSTIFYLTFGNSTGAQDFSIKFIARDENTYAIDGTGLEYGVWYNIRVVLTIGVSVSDAYKNRYSVFINGMANSTTTSAEELFAAPYANIIATNAVSNLGITFDNVYFNSTGDTVELNEYYGDGYSNDYSSVTGTQTSINNGVYLAAGAGSVADGAININVASNFYFAAFAPKHGITNATDDTIYVFEMDFTYRGGSKGGESNIAFVGFSANSGTPGGNGTMYNWGYLAYPNVANDADGDAPYVTLYGQKYYKNETVKIRYEYNVANNVMRVYHDDIYVGSAAFDKKGNTASETTMYWFSFYFRGSKVNGFEATIDNTYCGIKVANQKATLNAGEGTFTVNDQTVTTTTVPVAYGTTYTLPVPTAPAGKEFAGWYNTDGKYVGSTGTYYSFQNMSLTAKYVEAGKGRNGVSEYADKAINMNELNTTGTGGPNLPFTIKPAISGVDVAVGKYDSTNTSKRMWYNILGAVGDKYYTFGHSGGGSMSTYFTAQVVNDSKDYDVETYVYEFDFMYTGGTIKDAWGIKFQFTSNADLNHTVIHTNNANTFKMFDKTYDANKWYTVRVELTKGALLTDSTLDAQTGEYLTLHRVDMKVYIDGELIKDTKNAYGNFINVEDSNKNVIGRKVEKSWELLEGGKFIINTRQAMSYTSAAVDNVYFAKHIPAATPPATEE